MSDFPKPVPPEPPPPGAPLNAPPGDEVVLYLRIGEPQRGEGEETPEGHVVRYAPGTNRIPRRGLIR